MTAAQLTGWLAQGGSLYRHPFVRLAWTQLDRQTLALFYQGESLLLATSLYGTVRHIAEHRRLDKLGLALSVAESSDVTALLLRLVNAGILEPDGEF